MARKNMGKVKRYHRSFYSGGQQLRRILGAVLALAALHPAHGEGASQASAGTASTTFVSGVRVRS